MRPRIISGMLLLIGIVIACARNGSGYHDVKPPPLPPPGPPPPVPVELLVSIENSTYTASDFGAMESAVRLWLDQLSAKQLSYQLVFFRSSANLDGNYDTAPQGPRPVLLSSDADVAGEVHAAFQAIHAGPVGKSSLPLEIFSHAIADPRTSIRQDARQVLVSFHACSSESWMSGVRFYDAQKAYRAFFDSAFGAGNWRAFSVSDSSARAVSALFGWAPLDDASLLNDVGQRIADWSDYSNYGVIPNGGCPQT